MSEKRILFGKSRSTLSVYKRLKHGYYKESRENARKNDKKKKMWYYAHSILPKFTHMTSSTLPGASDNTDNEGVIPALP